MRSLCVLISFTYLVRRGRHVASPLSLIGRLWKGAWLPIPTWSASHAVSRLFLLVEGVVSEGEGRVVVLFPLRWVSSPLIASLSLAFLFVPSLLHPPNETRKVPSVSQSGSQQDSANEWMNEWIYQSINQSISQSTNQSIYLYCHVSHKNIHVRGMRHGVESIRDHTHNHNNRLTMYIIL